MRDSETGDRGMARNYFVQDPLSRAYGIEAPTLGAGSDLIPQQKQTREAPAASSPRQFFESLAGETGVPPNVLFAVGEQTAKARRHRPRRRAPCRPGHCQRDGRVR